jgi:hypothetical protein
MFATFNLAKHFKSGNSMIPIIHKIILNLKIWQTNKPTTQKKFGYLKPIDNSVKPFAAISCNILGPLTLSCNNSYVIVIVKQFSK